jgi:hypothetical protein
MKTASLDNLIVHAANWFLENWRHFPLVLWSVWTEYSPFYLLFYLELDLTLDRVPPAGSNTAVTIHFGQTS